MKLFPRPSDYPDIFSRMPRRIPRETAVDPTIRRGKLTFMIGLARSGKSSYCSRWVQYLEDVPYEYDPYYTGVFPRTIVCSDDIRLAVHGERFNKDAEPIVWAIHTVMAKALLSRGHDVIVDGTNTTEDSILRLLHIDSDATYKFIDTPKDECIRRAIASGHNDLVEYGVIERLSGQLERLKEEGIENVVERIRARVKKRFPTEKIETIQDAHDRINNTKGGDPATGGTLKHPDVSYTRTI